jgi:hypothetical protein
MQIDVESRVKPHAAPARPNLERAWIVHEPTISLLVSRRVCSSLKVYPL